MATTKIITTTNQTMKTEKGHIIVIVAPKQKIVKIVINKKVVKIYNFKMDIPKKIVEKEMTGYDWGTWSVSDRDYTYMQKVTEYDKDVIEDIKKKALEIYIQQTK